MPYRLLLDENVEHEVYHRLENLGHDVEHVELVDRLGQGVTDDAVAQYSLDTGRRILTYDDDFWTALERDQFAGVLYVEDQSIPPTDVADIVHAMARHYPVDELPAVQYAGREWL